MAEVVLQPGNEGPVNEGERRTLLHLQDHLPGSFEIHPNLQVQLPHVDTVEIDAVVIGPDRLWLLEIKDLAGDVIVGEQHFEVDGDQRAHPFVQVRQRAQRLKSRLADRHPALTSVWVEPLVVLAREPRNLEVTPEMRGRVVRLDEAVGIMTDPVGSGLRPSRLDPGQKGAVKHELSLFEPRVERLRFGQFVVTGTLGERDGSPRYAAQHQVLRTKVELTVHRIDPMAPPHVRDRRRRALEQVGLIGGVMNLYPTVHAPSDTLRLDDGSIVLVELPNDDPRLAGALSSGELDERRKRTALTGVAVAVAHAHRRGIAHRNIGPHTITVSPNGHPRLAGWDHATWDRPGNESIIATDWASVPNVWAAPERGAGPVGRAADLFGLARLAHALWPDGVPDDLADAIAALGARDPNARTVLAENLARLADPGREEGVSTAFAPAPGVLLMDRYRLVAPLGRGNFSSVWRARDELWARDVALKFFEGETAEGQVRAEFEALRGALHPNIVGVQDATRLGDRWVMFSEVVEGENLRAVVGRKELGESEALQVAVRLLDALRAVHPDMEAIRALAESGGEDEEIARLRRRGLTHGDVKPENVILHPERGPVLVDFGLAAAVDGAVSGGSPSYRPRDASPDVADPDADLFAVGVTLHEMLTGRHPYTDADPVAGVLEVDEGLPDPIRAVIERACAQTQEVRFGSAGEFLLEIATLGLPDVAVLEPRAPGAADLLDRLMQLAHEGRFGEALEVTPDDWRVVRERLGRLAEATRLDEPALIDIDGWRLRYQGEEPFDEAPSPAKGPAGPGTRRVYLMSGPGGALLEVSEFAAVDGQRWVAATDTFQTGMPLQRLGQGLRFSVEGLDVGCAIELRQARLKDGGWSNAYQATLDELDRGAGVDVAGTLAEFGASAVGTKEAVLGDSGRRRAETCGVFGPGAEHAPAVVYLLTRVLPLVNGVQA